MNQCPVCGNSGGTRFVVKYGMCNTCIERKKRNGEIPHNKAVCKEHGCERFVKARGWCKTHYYANTPPEGWIRWEQRQRAGDS